MPLSPPLPIRYLAVGYPEKVAKAGVTSSEATLCMNLALSAANIESFTCECTHGRDADDTVGPPPESFNDVVRRIEGHDAADDDWDSECGNHCGKVRLKPRANSVPCCTHNLTCQYLYYPTRCRASFCNATTAPQHGAVTALSGQRMTSAARMGTSRGGGVLSVKQPGMGSGM